MLAGAHLARGNREPRVVVRPYRAESVPTGPDPRHPIFMSKVSNRGRRAVTIDHVALVSSSLRGEQALSMDIAKELTEPKRLDESESLSFVQGSTVIRTVTCLRRDGLCRTARSGFILCESDIGNASNGLYSGRSAVPSTGTRVGSSTRAAAVTDPARAERRAGTASYERVLRWFEEEDVRVLAPDELTPEQLALDIAAHA